MTYKFKDDIDVEYLRSVLEYKPASGLLFWKPRPIEMFQDTKSPAGNMKIWNKRFAGQIASRLDTHGYLSTHFGKKKYLSARLAWAIYYGTWPEGEIDHINRDKTDNAIDNLRLATRSLNCFNRGLLRSNSSGVTGVSFDRESGKWVASISANGKQKNLGRFSQKQDAIAARFAAQAIREALSTEEE